MNAKDAYELRLRHLETPEFREWFEAWHSKESDYEGTGLVDQYLLERNFALIGWIAGRTEGADKMDRNEFVTKALPFREGEI